VAATTAFTPPTDAQLATTFLEYGPEMARRLEEREDELDTFVDIAILVSPRLWPHLGPDADGVRLVVEEVALSYRSHRERTPDEERLSVVHYVDYYLGKVKANCATAGVTAAAMWRQHIASLDPVVAVGEPLPSGVRRCLRCFGLCCLDNPHAEMVLLVDGQVIGGTTFDPEQRWSWWGPAGDSGPPPHPDLRRGGAARRAPRERVTAQHVAHRHGARWRARRACAALPGTAAGDLGGRLTRRPGSGDPDDKTGQADGWKRPTSVIHEGDEQLHYADHSHRWLCPDSAADEAAQEAWSNRVRAHLDDHRALLGQPPRPRTGSAAAGATNDRSADTERHRPEDSTRTTRRL
jgi:hypothetical protein